MKHTLHFWAAGIVLALLPVGAGAQSVNCDSITLPYSESFVSATGTMPPCWVYNSTYVGWNNWPNSSGDGELMFKAYSAGQPAVLPKFVASSFSKLEITFKTKCGTIAEGDAILIGAADDAGNLIQWIDTITSPDHSRNAWVWHTYNFLRYTGSGTRIAIGRLWNSTSDHWVAIDDISVRQLPNCYPPDSLEAHNLIDPDGISFSWVCFNTPEYWQVYVDTATVDIETVPESALIAVTSPSYTIPEGTLQGGGKYNFYVRSFCADSSTSDWVSYEFGAGTVVMNNTGVADIVTGCGLVVYDNGGPVAGYLEYSNSLLTIYPENAGNQLQVFGGAFGFGSSAASLNIYNGTSATGTPLYTYSTIDGRDTINSVLCTSTLGALTIKFTSSGNLSHTGYELYVRCTQPVSCPRPSELTVNMATATTANISWSGTAPSYRLYYHLASETTWQSQVVTTTGATLTGLMADSLYEVKVRALCSATDSSVFSLTRSFVAAITIDEDCPPVSNVITSDVADRHVRLQWTSEGTRWEVMCGDSSFITTNNPCVVSGLQPATHYAVTVRTLCDGGSSEWSEPVGFNTTNVGIRGVEEMPVSLYPNPAGERVNILAEGSISLLDLCGREVMREKTEGGRLTLDVSALPRGTYIVRIVGDETTAVRRLVVE